MSTCNVHNLYSYYKEKKTSSIYSTIKAKLQLSVKDYYQVLNRKYRVYSNLFYTLFSYENHAEVDLTAFYSPLDIQKFMFPDIFENLLVFLSCKEPETFATIVYFGLINVKLFNNNETDYFCFSTLPTVFKNLLFPSMHCNALKFIESLFQIHKMFCGYMCDSTHYFLREIMISFFGNCSLNQYIKKSLNKIYFSRFEGIFKTRFKYTKKDGKLIRAEYKTLLEEFCSSLILKLKYSIPLLNETARKIIGVILSIDNEDRIFSLVFAFDSMITIYFERPLLFSSDYNKLFLLDVANMFRQHYNSDNTSNLRSQMIDFLEAASLSSDYMSGQQSSFSKGISLIDPSMIFSFKDLNLLYRIISNYANSCYDCPKIISEFLSKPNKFSNGTSENSYYVAVQYEQHIFFKEMEKKILPLQGEEVLDYALSVIKLRRSLVSELQDEKVENYLIDLTYHQNPELLYHYNENQSYSQISEKSTSNRRNYEEIDLALTNTLTVLKNLINTIEYETTNLKNLLFESSMIENPTMLYSMFEKDDIDLESLCTAIISATEYDDEDSSIINRKLLLLRYFQLIVIKENTLSEKIPFEKISKSINILTQKLQIDRIGQHLSTRLRDATCNFASINYTNKFDEILSIIIRTMLDLNTDDIDLIAYVIVNSYVPFLKTLSSFISENIINKNIVKQFFTKEEWSAIKNFISAVGKISE